MTDLLDTSKKVTSKPDTNQGQATSMESVTFCDDFCSSYLSMLARHVHDAQIHGDKN